MKTLLTLVLLCAASFASAEELPDVPTIRNSTMAVAAGLTKSVERPKPSAWDYAAIASVAITRTLDYTSTEAFLTPKAIYGCPTCAKRAPGHEAILPSFVANNPAILGTFEAVSTALTAYGEYWMVRHGHARIGRVLMFAQAGSTLHVVVHNYEIAGDTVYQTHFTAQSVFHRFH
jgi:hypothetical protein